MGAWTTAFMIGITNLNPNQPRWRQCLLAPSSEYKNSVFISDDKLFTKKKTACFMGRYYLLFLDLCYFYPG